MKAVILFVSSLIVLAFSIVFFSYNYYSLESQKNFQISMENIKQLYQNKKINHALDELTALSLTAGSDSWKQIRVLKMAYLITILNDDSTISDLRIKFLNFAKNAYTQIPSSDFIKSILSYAYILNLDYDSASNIAMKIKGKDFERLKLVLYLKLNKIPKKKDFSNIEDFDSYVAYLDLTNKASSWEEMQDLVLSYLDRGLKKEAYDLIMKNRSAFNQNNPFILPYVAYDIGDYRTSAEALSLVLNDNNNLYALLGDIEFIQGNVEATFQDYQLAIRLDPKLSKDLYNNILWISKYLKIQSIDMEGLILTALKYFPYDDGLFINYINYLIETDQIAKALEYLNKNSSSKNEETIKLLSAILHKKQDNDEDKFLLRLWDIVNNYSNIENAAKILAYNLLKGNDLKGLKELILAIKDKQYSWTNLYQGFEILLNGDSVRAEEIWAEYNSGKFQPDVGYSLAVLYVKKKEYKLALDILGVIQNYLKQNYAPFLNKKGNRYSEFMLHVYYLYATIYRESDEYDLAMENLEQARAIDPSKVSINDLYSKVKRDLEKKYYEIGE